jgi:histone deacetylase complex regulatory component SIN3
LMEGSLDQAKFEDDCRDMFGISSYILFTIDKLIVQLARQLQTVLSEESCAKLLALYTYEGSRPKGSLELIYHSNVLELLNEDERCFRFEFNQDTCDFSIDLLDGTEKPRFLDLSFSKEKWAEYVDNYMQAQDTSLDVRKHKLFLTRELKKNAGKEALEGIEVRNGLECKICLTTYKLFYVEDTHDFLYRRGSLARARARAQAAKSASSKLEKLLAPLQARSTSISTSTSTSTSSSGSMGGATPNGPTGSDIPTLGGANGPALAGGLSGAQTGEGGDVGVGTTAGPRPPHTGTGSSEAGSKATASGEAATSTS